MEALCLIEALQFSANAVDALTKKCIVGIEADRARCEAMVEQSLAMVNGLVPAICYEQAAKLASRHWWQVGSLGMAQARA